MADRKEACGLHTPGPWKGKFDIDDWSVDGPRGGVCLTTEAIGAKGRRYPIALVIQRDKGSFGDGDAELSANVALLTAAPDLLEALEAVLRVADRKTVEFDMARAAIAKARGEAPTPSPAHQPLTEGSAP